MAEKKKIIILGSTGSIGRNTLDVVRRNRRRFEVLGLSGNLNSRLLLRQAEEFKPKYINIGLKDDYLKLKNNSSAKVSAGEEGLLKLSSSVCDILVLGISGLAALKPLFSSLGKAKKILLANKEAIIASGEMFDKARRKSSSQIISVDSEAWAVRNLLESSSGKTDKVYITASGGPFLRKDRKFLRKVSLKETLSHPVWRMGRKISVDSATLMNKGFEVMEISRLFGIAVEKIKVLIHPQSIIHALIEREDKTVTAFYFSSDMRIPISAGLDGGKSPSFTKPLDLAKFGKMEFLSPDYKKFPSLKLAYYVAEKQRSYPSVFVSADEKAVSLYLEGRIKFLQIYDIVKRTVDSHQGRDLQNLDDVLYWSRWAADKVKEIAGK